MVLPFGAHPASCPVRAAKAWRERANIKDGFLFRAVDRHDRIRPEGLHPDSMGGILKRMLKRAGYKPESYGGHSLRAGFARRQRSTGPQSSKS